MIYLINIDTIVASFDVSGKNHMPRQYEQQQLVNVSQETNNNAMDIDSSMEVDEEFELEGELQSESEDEAQEEERETALSTYLGKVDRQFIPYELNEETNKVDTVIDSSSANNDESAPVKWFCSSRIKGLKLVNEDYVSDMEKIAPFCYKQFWIESAVAGGRCSRLLLGTMQPEMHACVGKTFSEVGGGSRVYRLSKEIRDFYTWEDVYRHGNQLLAGKPVIGLTAVFLVNYFLANLDMNPENYGLVKLDGYWQAASIDPEACFSHHFYTDTKEDILAYIRRLPGKVPNQLFNKQELFVTLANIISTPLSAYEEIFDVSFSRRYARQKNIYTSAITQRFQLFKEVAYSLKGFKEYYEEERSKHLKKMEEDFKDIQVQQSENQQFLDEFCQYRPQPQNFWGNNRFGFYNNIVQQEQITAQPVSTNGYW